MKQRLKGLLALALSLTLVLALATNAWGATAVEIGGQSIGTGYWTYDGDTWGTGDADNYNVYFDGDKTLALNGFSGTSISANNSLKINLVGNNTVSNNSGNGIEIYGEDLTISGSGSLTATGSVYGIYANDGSSGGTVVISGGTVEANGGIYTLGGVSVDATGYPNGYQWKTAKDGSMTTEDTNLFVGFSVAYLKIEPINETYKDYTITENTISHVTEKLGSIADISGEDGDVTIKLKTNVNGRIQFGNNSLYPALNGNFVLDMNGKTIDAGGSTNDNSRKNEALCLDNDFDGTVTVLGSGTMKKGIHNIIYKGDGTLKFAVSENCDFFTLQKDGVNVFDAQNTTEKTTGTITGGDSLVLTQGTITTYTVTFDANGHGTAPTAQTVASGATASEPTAPTADGWTFGGWYKEAGCSNAFDFNTAITGNITLYAKWTENSGGVPGYTGGWYIPPVDPEPDKVEAAETFDSGIALSVAVTILSVTGSAWLAKKKED